jgi:hypothetical protein
LGIEDVGREILRVVGLEEVVLILNLNVEGGRGLLWRMVIMLLLELRIVSISNELVVWKRLEELMVLLRILERLRSEKLGLTILLIHISC